MRTHIKRGMLMFPVYFFAFGSIDALLFNEVFKPGLASLVTAYFLFVLGSDLPDVDASRAPVRWFVHTAFPGGMIALFWKLDPIWKLFERFEGLGPSLVVASGTIAGFFLGYVLDTLNHRSFLHTNLFGLIYASLCYTLGRFVLDLRGSELFFVALSGFFGVFLHLLLDYKLKAFVR